MEASQNPGATTPRIEPDTSAPPFRIRGRVLNEIHAHALETQPEECCGLITGHPAREPDRFLHVHRCRNEMTAHHQADPDTYPRSGLEAYYMNEADYLRAQTEAEKRGEAVTAVYHSHVGAGAYLSEMDLQFAGHALFPFPEAAQIVVALAEGRVVSAALFEPTDGGVAFRGRLLEAGEP